MTTTIEMSSPNRPKYNNSKYNVDNYGNPNDRNYNDGRHNGNAHRVHNDPRYNDKQSGAGYTTNYDRDDYDPTKYNDRRNEEDNSNGRNHRSAHYKNAKYNGAINHAYDDEFNSYKQDIESSRKRIPVVTIIGSGDLARALVVCFTRSGFKVVVGSRHPDQAKSDIESLGGEMCDIETAVSKSNIIIISIPFEGFSSLDANLFAHKTVIDPSNRPPKYDSKGPSLARNLQNILPRSKVVKAFNTMSAYSLQQGRTQGSKEVPICGDDRNAKDRVSQLVRDIGFTPIDNGGLENAVSIEDIPHQFFPEWTVAFFIMLGVWLFAFTLLFFRDNICSNLARADGKEWKWASFRQLIIHTANFSCSSTALTLLAFCYLPGVFAGYIQLWRGTKYLKFPTWLDTWLKSRKQLGLFSLWLAGIHVLFTIGFMMKWGLGDTWTAYQFWCAGVMALSCMTVLGIASLPSVAAALSWSEFSFIQRYLGWWSLTFATLHIVFMNWGHLFVNKFTCIFLPDQAQTFVVIPIVTIALKLPLLLPFVNSRLVAIRRGQIKK